MKIEKEILEEFDKKYGYEEIEVCKKCGHSIQSHYWNGGGREEYSGYDACLIKGCDCKCLSDDYDIKKYPANQEIKDFIFQAIQKYNQRIKEEIKSYVENYFDGLIVIPNPEATKESLLKGLKNIITKL